MVVGLDRFITFPDKLNHFNKNAIDLIFEIMDDIFVEIRSHEQFVEETYNKIRTGDNLVINKDHSTPADSGRTGHGEIGHFE